MIEHEFLELIHGEIDGENSPEQSRRLSGYLGQNPEASQLFEELKAIGTDFERMQSVPVPADFKATIMDELPDPSMRSVTGRFRPPTPSRRFRPYGYAAAAGLLLGVVLASWYWSGDQRLPSPSLISGTMLEPQTAWLPRVPIEGEKVQGSLEALETSQGIQLNLNLDSEQPCTVFVEYQQDRATFRGFNFSDGAVEELSLEGSMVRFVHNGQHQYQLLFEPSVSEGPSFKVSIVSGDTVVFSSEFGRGTENR